MPFPTPTILQDTSAPLRRAVRRFRWFKRSFEEQMQSISSASGVVYEVKSDRLARVFVAWVRSVEEHRASFAGARRQYIEYASGLMLRHLIVEDPLTVASIPVGSDASNPAYYWPTGYVYVAYCLNVRMSVIEQEFDESIGLAPELSEARTWWSFKENVAEDPTLAISFLDLFSGAEPNWTAPGRFYRRAETHVPEMKRIDGGGA